MTRPVKSPGPAAERAFQTGVWSAAVSALAVVGALYWTGALAGYVSVFVVIVLFPVYLVVVASVLSKWLGFARGPVNLRRVTREDDDGPRSGQGPW